MYILVKNLNGRLIFIMDNEVDFEVLLNELKGLLVQSFFKKKDYYPKAFFDLKGRILENDEILQFFSVYPCQKALPVFLSSDHFILYFILSRVCRNVKAARIDIPGEVRYNTSSSDGAARRQPLYQAAKSGRAGREPCPDARRILIPMQPRASSCRFQQISYRRQL